MLKNQKIKDKDKPKDQHKDQSKSSIHEFHRFWKDILRDTNSSKYSMTKFAALIGLILFVIFVIFSTHIMFKKNEIDHVLLIEIIGLILTLLGFKNNFGFSTNNKGEQQFTMGSGNNGGGNDGYFEHNNHDNNYDDGKYHGEYGGGGSNYNNNNNSNYDSNYIGPQSNNNSAQQNTIKKEDIG